MTNTAATLDLINTSTGPVQITREGRLFTVQTLDWQLSLRQRGGSVTFKEWTKNTRVYGALQAFVPDFDARETELWKAITDHSVKDPALARFQRQSVAAARVELERVLPEALAWLRASAVVQAPEPITVKFSRNAGCSLCPCSPGFVASARISVGGCPVDMWFRTV